MPKDEKFKIESKKMPDRNKSKTSGFTADKAQKELKDIAKKQADDMLGVKKLSTTIRTLLNPATMGLPEEAIFKKEEVEVKDDNLLRIVGKTKNSKQDIEAILKEQIESQNHAVSMYNHTGVYARILQSRQNRFMEDNMPSLETSLRLFIDDVCNGSYRGSEYGDHNKFRFYKRGAEINDPLLIDKMTDMLNPKSYIYLMDNVKSFDDIDIESDYTAMKDGMSFTWVIQHKDVAKDLYIKYVSKELKRKSAKGKVKSKNVTTAVSNEALDDINMFLEDYGIKVSMESDLREVLSDDIFQELPSDLYSNKTEYYQTISGESVQIDEFTYNEFNKTESFFRFAERYLSGECHRVYNINTAENASEVLGGECFTYETQGYPRDVGQRVLSELYQLRNQSDFGMESTIPMIDSFSSITSGDALIPKIIDDVSFDDIYSTSSDIIANYNGFGTRVSTESVSTSYNSSTLRNATPKSNADRIFLSVLRHLDTKISMEGPIRVDNTLQPSYGEIMLGGVPVADKRTSTRDAKEQEISEKVKEKTISRNRLDKIFGGIKGETVVLLDNTRVIPNMAGDKCIGVYYIEYTHQDIQHYIGLRTILGNPVSFTQNIDMLNIDTEQQEETLGRLIFSDTIKPLLEKNMDTKFLKNNSSMLYTIKKLLEENEVSNSMSFNDMTRYSMYNLSRIIYIPATELVFKRNGSSGLGESLFNKAIVPASACILAKEAYLSWILCDGKGYTFITVPKGLSEIGGEYGTEPLKEKIDNMRVSRSKLRDIAFNNAPLTRTIMTMVKDDDATGNIEIQDIEPPDFEIDQDIIRSWEEEATSIVGYSAALFQSRDGQIELAKKLFEINDSVLIRVIKARKNKKTPSSQLATKLLHARGGEEYYDITVEWIEPPIDKGNNLKRSEMVNEIKETYNTISELYDSVYENAEDYELVKPELMKILLSELADSDKVIVSMEDYYKKAKDKALVKLTKEVSEAEFDEKEKEKEEERKANQDPDNPFAEQNLDEPAEDNNQDNDQEE